MPEWGALIFFYVSGGGDGGGCQHSSQLVTRQDVCELQQFPCPCAVDWGAVDAVLGKDGGEQGGWARARQQVPSPKGGGDNLNFWAVSWQV